MSALVLLTLVCVVTYTVEIVFALGGTILMLTVMTTFYASKTLVIYSCMPQILVATIGLIRSPRTVDLRFLSGMLGFAVLGGFVGLYLFFMFPPATFQYLLAGAITLFGLYLVVAPAHIRLNRASARLLDALAGASQALFGISGPINMTRLLGTIEGKTVIRNYALAFFLSINVFRAGGYVLNHSFTPEIREMMLVSGPFIAAALWYSNHLHFKVNERMFRRTVSWIILAGGLSLFFR